MSKAPQPIGQSEDGRPVYRRADVVEHARSMSHGGGLDVLALRNARGEEHQASTADYRHGYGIGYRVAIIECRRLFEALRRAVDEDRGKLILREMLGEMLQEVEE
jgi:hypothetical protein